MVAALRGLAANLVAGLRLAWLLPVARHAFRIDAAQLALLAIVSALVDVAGDWLRQPPAAHFDAAGVGGELAALAILLLIAALLAWLLRDAPLLVALPVVVLASMPIVQLANALSALLSTDERPQWLLDLVDAGLLGWFLLVLARASYVALAPHAWRPLRALAAAAMFAATLLIPAGVLPEGGWWTTTASPALDPQNPAAEPILTLQRELQDEALAALGEHTQGEADLYFVAFAPDGSSAKWSAHLEAARRTMDAHWGTEGRSLVYVNDYARLTDAPIASVTHLREALEEIAAASNPDEDIVMLYLAGRSNADGSMAVSLPPPGLVPLSGPGLASLLRQAGIRWRVVVVATCTPQPFVDALADAQSLVVAAPEGSDGAGACAPGRDPGAFGDALFAEALASAPTIPAAVARLHKRFAAQGLAPTVRVGAEIGAQLARVRNVQGGRAAARSPERG